MIETITIKEVKVQLGLLCQQFRKQANLSRQELSDALSISSNTLLNIENGKNANLDTVLKIAAHFGQLETISQLIMQQYNSRATSSLY